MTLIAAALQYLRAGITTIPVKLDGSKAPAVSTWAKWHQHPPEEKDTRAMFREPSGIAVLGGKVSGGLEIIDFDIAGAFDVWAQLVEDLSPGLLARLPVVSTPNGHHVYIRSDCFEGNQKLAFAKESFGDKKSNVKIETRGQGGYVIAPPSPAAVHKSGQLYAYLRDEPRIENTPILTAEERELLLSAARSFNEVAVDDTAGEAKSHSTSPTGKGRPGDLFAEHTSWSEILTPHGWREISSRGEVSYWQRPGKSDRGISATTGYTGDKLYVFSSNAQPFISQRAYSKFSAFGILSHGGDFSAAAKELRARGFKAPQQDRPRPSASWDELTGPPPNGEPPPYLPPPTDAEEPPQEEPIHVELERLLDDDVGAALRPQMFARLLATRSDKAEWLRILDLLRRRKIKREFEAAVKDHDKVKGKIHSRRRANGDWKTHLLYRETKDGGSVLETCLTNVVLVLTNDEAWSDVLAFDEFSNQIVTQRSTPFDRTSTRWDDTDALETKSWIERNYALRPTTAMVCEAILIAAKRCTFNALKVYLDGLEDSERDSLDTWLIDFFGAPDTPYVRAVGAKWLIAAVARAYEPGCKVDTVLILEGTQGLKKSRVLEQLCPKLSWFADGLSDFGTKAQAEEVEGKWIIELGELKGFGRELEQIKAFVTRRAENYRPAYARYSVHSPRKCVFAGTVNPNSVGYLRDETGNRRFWPVECTKQAPELTPALRDQLWAEARNRYRAGERWWLEGDDLIGAAAKEQEDRVMLDMWHDTIADFLIGKTDICMDEIMNLCLKIERRDWDNAKAQRVGRVLSALKWTKYRKRSGTELSWRYRSPAMRQTEIHLVS